MIAMLTGLAAHGLPGARVAPFGEAPMADDDWATFWDAATGHGLGGLLMDAIQRGAFVCTPAQRDAADQAHVRSMSSCLTLESALLDAVRVLDERSIEAVVVSGSVGAHLDYPDPALRSFGDVDLLVPASDLRAARDVLAPLGFRPAGRGQPDRLVDGFGRQLDLHTHVLPRDLARHIPRADLWRQPRDLVLGGQTVRVLGDDPRLVSTCLKAATGSRRLIAVRDVTQQVLGHREPGAAIELARRWQVAGGMAAAIDDAWTRFELADVVALSVWAARNRSDHGPTGARPTRAHSGRRWLVRR